MTIALALVASPIRSIVFNWRVSGRFLVAHHPTLIGAPLRRQLRRMRSCRRGSLLGRVPRRDLRAHLPAGENPPVCPALPAALKNSGRGARHLTCGARAFRGQPRARDSDGSVLARWRERAAPGGGTSPTRSVPEMLGRRRTQAGVIIRTDSQRNVSRGNRVGWAIFRGQASHPIFEIFCHPWAIRMGPNSGKHRPVRIGSPAPRSGATIPGEGKPGPVADTRTTWPTGSLQQT